MSLAFEPDTSTLNINPLRGVPGISSVSIVLSPQVRPFKGSKEVEGPCKEAPLVIVFDLVW